MRTLVCIKLICLFSFICNNCSKSVVATEKFSLKISFIGNIDKPLPTIIFLDSSEENFKLFNYNYNLSHNSYNELKKVIQNQVSKPKLNPYLIHIEVNQIQDYYFNKENSLLIISKIIDLTRYKKNERLKSQLDLYLRVIKSR